MSEQLQETPASLSPVSRFIGVIVSPQETFKDIERKPGWLFPLVAYFCVFTVAFSFYATKADWITIVTDQVSNFPLLKMAPEQAQEQAIKQATDTFRKLTPAQITIQGLVQFGSFFLLLFHLITVLYSTLFVLMGSLKDLKLGRAWLQFLLCLLLYIGYIVVNSAGTFMFREEPGNALMLNAVAAVLMVFVWGWLLSGFARKDPDFRKMLSVTTHVTPVWSVGALALLAISIATPAPIVTPAETIVRSNLGALVHTGIPALQKLLESLDFFTVWSLIVLGIGYRVMTRTSTNAAMAITFLLWGVFWVLPRVAWAAIFG